ncbi:hypothetical protein MHF_1423 [Mycoplasma haemofelis Ohio2]|uniref:Uncharacterized protein n=1 Tax=Mycoplasma haemofelis (strain Ohio2) TaxID=859194 RepID=F6FGL9_MYCHI|nr:hypothetical protein MHF_1423 [Mycoplasma haemofelis Ohio2]
MSSSTAIKLASGLGAAGAVGGGIALHKSGAFETKVTLKEVIEKDKWTLLTSSNTEQINKILTAYKKNEDPKPTLLFEGFSGNEENASQRLLEECQKSSSKPFDDSNKDTLLKQIKKWCVIPKTVEQRLKDSNLKAIDTTAPTNPTTEKQEWVTQGSKHKEGASKISGVATTGNEQELAKALREGCKGKNAVNSYDEDFETALNLSTLWCSTKIDNVNSN